MGMESLLLQQQTMGYNNLQAAPVIAAQGWAVSIFLMTGQVAVC